MSMITVVQTMGMGDRVPKLITCLLVLFLAADAEAQFTGPSTAGRPSTVAQVQNARLGSYVTLTGHVIAHQRRNFFTFRDSTGELRVEIEDSVWQGQKVSPETKVRLLGEVDRGISGRYVWVKSLQIVP